MWFRNLQLYRLTDGFDFDPESLHQALSTAAFRPCAGLDTHSAGWVPPAGREATELVHASNGRMMVCLRREDRILPAAVIREQVEEKAEAIALAEGRSVGRKERQQIKDEVVTDLLPRAFTRSSHLYAYIDPADGWVVVDSATPKKAEDLLSALRETLGSLQHAAAGWPARRHRC
jgi:recombination associated protein RdgC